MCLEREREREREREIKSNAREKKKRIKYKIQMNSNCVNIHSYCSNNGYLHNFSLIEVGCFLV